MADVVILINLVTMVPLVHQFITLPSGLIVNLSQVSRVIPVDGTLEVHFTGGDKTVLQGEGAESFRKKSGLGGWSSNTAKTAIFWAVIITSALLVYLAVRTRG